MTRQSVSFLLRFIKSALRDVAEKAPEEIEHLPIRRLFKMELERIPETVPEHLVSLEGLRLEGGEALRKQLKKILAEWGFVPLPLGEVRVPVGSREGKTEYVSFPVIVPLPVGKIVKAIARHVAEAAAEKEARLLERAAYLMYEHSLLPESEEEMRKLLARTLRSREVLEKMQKMLEKEKAVKELSETAEKVVSQYPGLKLGIEMQVAKLGESLANEKIPVSTARKVLSEVETFLRLGGASREAESAMAEYLSGYVRGSPAMRRLVLSWIASRLTERLRNRELVGRVATLFKRLLSRESDLMSLLRELGLSTDEVSYLVASLYLAREREAVSPGFLRRIIMLLREIYGKDFVEKMEEVIDRFELYRKMYGLRLPWEKTARRFKTLVAAGAAGAAAGTGYYYLAGREKIHS